MLFLEKEIAHHERIRSERENVRFASIGACTIASPHKWNDIFVIMGTPIACQTCRAAASIADQSKFRVTITTVPPMFFVAAHSGEF
jgi:hypothetical protein